jgi:hypothetical protein
MRPGQSSRRGELRRDLRACSGDGATYCLMVGAAETYFSALALALGKSSIVGGLAATLPNLAGALLQLASPTGLRRLGSPRRWIQGCAILQGTALLALASGAAVGHMPTWLIFGCLAIYWSAALGAGPAWNTWVARLFPARLRARYFAARSRLCKALQLLSMLGAGGLLWLGERSQWPLPAFAAVLAFAATCRFSSVAFLQAQGDIVIRDADVRRVPWRTLPRRLLHGDLRLLLFLTLFTGALQSGGPFITPWLIDRLGMDKFRFTLCVAMVFISKILALPIAARVVRRLGAWRVMGLGALGTGVAIAILPLHTGLAWILLVQTIFGISIAGAELAGFLLQLETLRHEERTSLMSTYMLMNCAATAGGSLIGAAVLKGLGDWMHAYAAVFVLSGLLRAGVLLVRPPRPRPQAVVVAEGARG